MGWGVPEAGRQCYNSPMNSDLSGTRTTTTRTTRPRMPFLGRTLDRGPTNIALTILQINWTTWINLERDYWKVQQTKYFDTAVQILNEQQCKYFDTTILSKYWYLQNPQHSLSTPDHQQESNYQLRLDWNNPFRPFNHSFLVSFDTIFLVSITRGSPKTSW